MKGPLADRITGIFEIPSKTFAIFLALLVIGWFILLLVQFSARKFTGEVNTVAVRRFKVLLTLCAIISVAIGIYLLVQFVSVYKNGVSSIKTYQWTGAVAAVSCGALGVIFYLLIRSIKRSYLRKNPVLFKVVLNVFIFICCILVLVLVALSIKANGGDIFSKEITAKSAKFLALAVGTLVVLYSVNAAKADNTETNDFNAALYGIIAVLSSMILSQIKIDDYPGKLYPGTLTLIALVPVIVYSYVYGSEKGLLIGTIAGALAGFFDPNMINPAEYLMVYIAAFGVAGFFSGNPHYANYRPFARMALSTLAVFVSRGLILIATYFIFAYIRTPEVLSMTTRVEKLANSIYMIVDILIPLAIDLVCSLITILMMCSVKSIRKQLIVSRHNNARYDGLQY